MTCVFIVVGVVIVIALIWLAISAMQDARVRCAGCGRWVSSRDSELAEIVPDMWAEFCPSCHAHLEANRLWAAKHGGVK